MLAGGEFSEETAAVAIATLERARQQAAQWGLSLREVNTDRGAQFRSLQVELEGCLQSLTVK